MGRIVDSQEVIVDSQEVNGDATGRARNQLLYGADRKSLAAGLTCLLIVGGVATLGAILAPDPFAQNSGIALTPPSRYHLLGTDQLGRDMFARIAAGTRYTIGVSVASLVVGGAVGSAAGIVSGYFNKTWGRLIDPVMEFFMSFPGLLLGIIAAASFGNNLPSLVAAISTALIPRYAIVVRAETLALREMPFVEGARVIGVGDLLIMKRHILRNVWSGILLLCIVYFPLVVAFEASLSYLGLGVPADVPTLGRLIGDGQDLFIIAPWISTWPGVSLLLIALGFNLVSDSLTSRGESNV